MTASEIASSYRLYAAECVEIARDLEPERKLALLNIAQAWLNPAAQVAKNSEVVLVYETPSRPEELAPAREEDS